MKKNPYFRYIGTLTFVFLVLSVLTFSGVRFLKVAPAFTQSFGINARLQFLKNLHLDKPTTFVLGASVAAFNIDTDLMSEAGDTDFVNAGSYGFSIADQRTLYSILKQSHPIEDIIFVSVYYEYRSTQPDRLESPKSALGRYVKGKMTPFEEATYFQLPMLIGYFRTWDLLHGQTTAHSIAYSRTGATPLDMDVRVSDPDHLTASGLGTESFCQDCMNDLESLCEDVRADGRDFTVVLGPVQLSAIQDLQRHQDMRVDRRARIRQTVEACGGNLFDAGDFAPFEDACFADYSHLNRRGMTIFSEMLSRYMAGNFTAPSDTVRCE